MSEKGCPWFDEYNGCCMWDRIEKIFCFPWEKPGKEIDKVTELCLEDMA